MEVLRLTLKKKWFDMILSGEKKEEYREIKPYWETRLEEAPLAPFLHRFKKFDAVEFTNGYGNDKPKILIECCKIDLDYGRPEWGAKPNKPYYVIYLGDIIGTQN